MDKELILYNVVRLFREKGFTDDQIADALEEIRKKLEVEVNG